MSSSATAIVNMFLEVSISTVWCDYRSARFREFLHVDYFRLPKIAGECRRRRQEQDGAGAFHVDDHGHVVSAIPTYAASCLAGLE